MGIKQSYGRFHNTGAICHAPFCMYWKPDSICIIWSEAIIHAGLARLPVINPMGSLISDVYKPWELKRRYFHLLSLFAVVCIFYHDSLQFRKNLISDGFLLPVFVSFSTKETIFAVWFQDANALMTDRSNKDTKNSQKNGKIWINKVSVWYWGELSQILLYLSKSLKCRIMKG